MSSRLELRTTICAPVQRCFDLSRNIDVHAASMAGSRERAVGGVTSGLIELGEEVAWQARHFGIRWRATSEITEFDPPHRFVDEMKRGPFSHFRHLHRFEQHGATTTMIDIVDFRFRFGPLSGIATLLAGKYLRRLLGQRNVYIKKMAEQLFGPRADQAS